MNVTTRIRVTYPRFETSFLQTDSDGMETEAEEEFDTVLMAVGRQALSEEVAAKQAGVNYNPHNKKIPAENEQTNVPSVYAIGDVLEVRIRYRSYILDDIHMY